jgi:hypothetical protein
MVDGPPKEGMKGSYWLRDQRAMEIGKGGDATAQARMAMWRRVRTVYEPLGQMVISPDEKLATQEGDVEEAPADGKMYVRQNGAWVLAPIQQDALADDESYARYNNDWVRIAASFTLRYEYTFNGTTAEPPGSGQIRMDTADQKLATFVWISGTDVNSVDETNFLKLVEAGLTLFMQDKDDATKTQRYSITGATFKTDYLELQVIWETAGQSPLPAGQRVIMLIANLGVRAIQQPQALQQTQAAAAAASGGGDAYAVPPVLPNSAPRAAVAPNPFDHFPAARTSVLDRV